MKKLKDIKNIKKIWEHKKIRNTLLGSIALILLAIIIFDEISLVFGGIALISIGVILLILINHND